MVAEVCSRLASEKRDESAESLRLYHYTIRELRTNKSTERLFFSLKKKKNSLLRGKMQINVKHRRSKNNFVANRRRINKAVIKIRSHKVPGNDRLPAL